MNSNKTKSWKRLSSKVLPYFELNQLQTEETRSKKKLNSFNFLTTEKINITNTKVGARTKLEWYKWECEEYGHNVRNTVTKRPILDFWKLKTKFKKIKKNEYISLISIQDIEKTTSHSRQKSNLLNRIKQEKAEFRHTKRWNILQKSGQKKFKTVFMKKFSVFLKT